MRLGVSGTYSLAGSGQLYALSPEYVGSSGIGSFVQAGGFNYVASYYTGLYLGDKATAQGTYNLSGTGLLTAPVEYVGNAGSGVFTHSGGTNMVEYQNTYGNLYLAYAAGSSGTYNLSGSAVLSALSEYVGYSGTGSLSQSGGSNGMSGNLYMGYTPGAVATYALAALGGCRPKSSTLATTRALRRRFNRAAARIRQA